MLEHHDLDYADLSLPAGIPLGQAISNFATGAAEQLHVWHVPRQQRIQLHRHERITQRQDPDGNTVPTFEQRADPACRAWL